MASTESKVAPSPLPARRAGIRANWWSTLVRDVLPKLLVQTRNHALRVAADRSVGVGGI